MMSQEGDLVIIYSKEHPELQWKRGTILELHKSDEGQVGKAKVRIRTIETVKARNHLYPLEAKVEESLEYYNKRKSITLNLKVSHRTRNSRIEIEWKP